MTTKEENDRTRLEYLEGLIKRLNRCFEKGRFIYRGSDEAREVRTAATGEVVPTVNGKPV